MTDVKNHPVVSHDKWIDARVALLKKEKEFTRLKDDIARQRRELPWEKVEKKHVLTGPKGKEALADLFENRSQLIVYHFMFDPSWDAGCPHCSHAADSFDGIIVHLNQRDATMVAVSLAPYDKLAAYEKRMGWSFKWLSASDADFNFDYRVSFTPEELAKKKANYNFAMQDPGPPQREGISVFYKNASSEIFHTYSAYARGIEIVMVDYQYLDLLPKGRNEDGRGPFWVKRHDEYDSVPRG
ncbi:MAG: thioredoxin family protein [Acidobacteriota bacterium]|nr:thioredoxin family protein [Acidobacteriota bacterium]